MVETPSSMVPLGTTAPYFSLPDTASGKMLSLDELKSDQATAVMFICNHCPFVKHVQAQLVELANDYGPKGVSFIAINSNNVNSYPEDSPDNMKKVAERMGYGFPYLYDETQEVAKAYKAACTPDFYIFDGELELISRDKDLVNPTGSRIQVTGKDMRAALDNILAGEPVSPQQRPSVGCNIKWKY